MDENSGKKRLRDDSDESELESPEVKRLRDDLFEFLDDSDHTPSIQDLDSIMKSLQEEISASPSPASLNVTSDSIESQAQIGYLLEASDDELGIPPSGDSNSLVSEKKSDETEFVRVLSNSSGIGELWEFEDRVPSYDSFDLGSGFGYYDNHNSSGSNIEYVPFHGLFNHSDLFYDSADFSEAWRHGTLPAR